MIYEVYIMNGTTAYEPAVEDEVKWETTRTGEPGVLRFTCIQDGKLNIDEGNAVKFIADKKNIFFGFIFVIKPMKSGKIEVTAYDQIRYLKNKDSYVYKNKRADQVISMISSDFGLKVGSLENTGYIIPAKVEDNKTLIDIILNALDETLRNTKTLYVLYDDFGKLTLKNTENMLLNVLIDSETGQNFNYSSSINENTYNQIKITYDNDKTGKREVYIAKDSSKFNTWGVLQYYESVDNNQGITEKVNALLSLYNKKTRKLKMEKVFGDTRVRAGCSVVIKLNIGGVNLESYMLVEKAVHTFSKDSHFMDLTLRGGEFVA